MSQTPQVIFFVGSMLLFALWLAIEVIRWGWMRIRRRTTLPVLPRNRWIERAATVTALFGFGGFVLFSALGFAVPSLAMMVGVPAAFYALPLCFTAACLSVVPLIAANVFAWREHVMSLSLRLVHTAVMLVGVAFIPFCMYWQLFGLHI
jgi:hypothetical protein